VYNAFDDCVQIIEMSGSTVNDRTQFVWEGGERREKRDSAGNLIRKYFSLGFADSADSYFYFEDGLGSVYTVTDQSGLIRAKYLYTPFGQSTKVSGDIDSDIQYAHYYFHKPSSFMCAELRFYSPNIGRWINRDPIDLLGENAYAYVKNAPINSYDPQGTNGLVLGAGTTIILVATGILFVITASGAVLQIIALNKKDDTPPLPTPEELAGKTVEEVKEILENLGLVPKPTNPPGGVKYPVPGKPGDQYRIKQPETAPRTPPEKQGWNCVISKNGAKTRVPLQPPQDPSKVTP